MSRTSNVTVALFVSAALVSLAACDDGKVAVGSTDQKLQTRQDGTPTGNGSTCSWIDPNTPVSSDGPDAAKTVYNRGDEFTALDGCNECVCAEKGIMCTVRACGGGSEPGNPGQPVACDDSAKVCPDGSAVGRTGPNCAWAPCPQTGDDCSADPHTCPSGESCFKFPGSDTLRCSSDPCSACASSAECQILESFPAQVRCQ